MATYAGFQKLGTDLCGALGLDAANVIGITLDCRVGEVPTATVQIYIRNDGYAELIEAVKRFELRELED